MKKITIFRHLCSFFGRISLCISARMSLKAHKDAVGSDVAMKIDRWTKEKGWTEDLCQEDVARELNIRSEQLSLYFRTRTGKSFLRWRRELRVEEAKRILLENREMPTGLVGEAVGIPDKSNFRRQFKEVTGYTPAQWRQLKQ